MNPETKLLLSFAAVAVLAIAWAAFIWWDDQRARRKLGIIP
jgi:hypothetical protein